MNRAEGCAQVRCRSMPHVCGDEPKFVGGWWYPTIVCPTYVGMNRPDFTAGASCDGMPHVCGDEPNDALTPDQVVAYAPRMWGDIKMNGMMPI